MDNKKLLKSFKDLIVWQKAVDLAALVYKFTEAFPNSELYGITNQMRRSVISISSNIAEGFKRDHKKEKQQFYNIAYGSTAELESQIEIAYKLMFLKEDDYKKLNILIIEISKMIDGLKKSTNKLPKSYILYPTLLFIILSSISYILNPLTVEAAEIFFIPETQSIQPESYFQVDLLLDAQNEDINAIEGKIIIPSDSVEVKEILDGDSVINFWIEKPRLENNEIIFSGAIPGGFKGVLSPFREGYDPGKIFSIILQTKNNTGNAIINLKDAKAFLNDGLGTEAKLSIINFYFTINKEAPAIAGLLPIKDPNAPEDFEPIISEIDSKWFLIFNTQDKGSGILRYEVAEGRAKPPQNRTPNYARIKWVQVESPYLLKDQSLQSYVYVKAVDKAGNEKIAVVAPQNPVPDYNNYVFWVILLVIMLFAVKEKLKIRKLKIQ